MPCLIGCIALFMPRLAIVLVVIFSDFIGDACRTIFWPLLGFIFMPLTTLVYAWAWHFGGGSVSGLGLVLIITAAMVDLGLLGTGTASSRQAQVVYVQRRRSR